MFSITDDWERWLNMDAAVTGAGAPTHTILDDGDIWVMLDATRGVYYVDALVESSPVTLRRLFGQLESCGLTLMEEDDGEYEPPELPSGHIRRFLVPDWD